MNNTSGFMLPYVLLIVSIIFIVATANINIYEQEIEITEQYIEQLKVESLLQMAHDKFRNEHSSIKADRLTVEYDLPSGLVIVSYTIVEEKLKHLHFEIFTDKQSHYTFLKTENVTKD